MSGPDQNWFFTRARILFAATLLLLLVSSCVSDGGRFGIAECPQPRFTGKAPEPAYSRTNPLVADSTSLQMGRQIYEETAQPSCSVCHGVNGDGKGPLSNQFNPSPRNFACAETVSGIPDGQLFWIIQNGSPGTSMPSFDYLGDEEIWQLVLHLRSLAEK
jgi:mono/diheme cytochrome c family protein